MLNHHTPDPDAVPVVLRGVSACLDQRPIIQDIDLTVAPGEFVALMGGNGSGKSTLVRTMTGLLPLSAGSLDLFGQPIEEFSQWQRIGLVPQRHGAGSGVPASVWEVVASGRLTHRRLLRPLTRADRAAIDEAISVVGLSARRSVGVATLSGGQQQRTLIARALASRPELLFLDEPTAGVDLPNQEVLAQTLELLSRRGVTIVLVAHELGSMEPLIDRSVVLRGGRVVYDGPPLADHEVHSPFLGEAHTHQHHPLPTTPPHVPRVVSPLDPDDHPIPDGAS